MSKRGNGEGTLYKRPNGSWSCQVTLVAADGTSRRRSVTASTQREARSQGERLRREHGAGLLQAGEQLTVTAWGKRWIQEVLRTRVAVGDLAPATADSYATQWRLHVEPLLGAVRLRQLQPSHVRMLINQKVAPGKGGRALSPRSVKLVHATLRKCLNDAVREGLLERNVALAVDPPRASARAERVALERDEARRLAAACEAHPLGTLWLAMLMLGLRPGEALALRWSDIDFAGRSVNVKRSIQRQRGLPDALTGRTATELVERPRTKTGTQRRLVLPARLVEALVKHRAAQSLARTAAPAWADDDLVFTTPHGTALEPRNVARAWRPFVTSVLGRYVNPHGLRHAAATLLLAGGVNVKLIQEQLGHSRIGTTMDIYTAVLQELTETTALAMDGLLADTGT